MPAAKKGPATDLMLPIVATILTVVALLAGALVLLNSSQDASGGGTDAAAAGEAREDTPRFTGVSILVGGLNKDRIDRRAFDIIAAGVPWDELGKIVFPGSEVESVMVYQEERGLSVGLGTEPPDPARVDSIWRDMGQPDRKRPLYFLPIGDLRSKRLEAWLKEKLGSLGFQLTSDRSKAREGVMLTLAR